MAIDEALLVSGGPPTLRMYGWSPPGLSIGYFQEVAPFRQIPGDHVLVRRPTGGGAIYHGHEVTFALTLDAALLPGSLADSYRLIHTAVAAALQRVGVPVNRIDPPPAGRPARPHLESPWCFANPGPPDLVDAQQRKILGSAQRRIRRPRPRTLTHGSLVLSRPAATPFCAAVADHVRPDDVLSDLEDSLSREIAAGLALHPRDGEITAAELATARDVMNRRYGNSSFTNRR